MAQKTFKYTNGEVTVVWKPGVCIHSGICVKGLPEVFDNKEAHGLIQSRRQLMK